jgi:hypothetical protein
MRQDEIIEMAKQATIGGDEIAVFTVSELMKFAKLVAQHEREACAKVCEEMRTYVGRNNAVTQSSAQDCATAIRARGQSL